MIQTVAAPAPAPAPAADASAAAAPKGRGRPKKAELPTIRSAELVSTPVGEAAAPAAASAAPAASASPSDAGASDADAGRRGRRRGEASPAPAAESAASASSAPAESPAAPAAPAGERAREASSTPEAPPQPQIDALALGKEWLLQTLTAMGYTRPRVSGQESENAVEFQLSGGGMEELFAPRNARARTEVIDALQALLQKTLWGPEARAKAIVLDVDGFRAGRTKALAEAAQRAAAFVAATGTPLRISSMNSIDRRAMHSLVQSEEGVRSESDGEGSLRRLNVLPNRRP